MAKGKGKKPLFGGKQAPPFKKGKGGKGLLFGGKQAPPFKKGGGRKKKG